MYKEGGLLRVWKSRLQVCRNITHDSREYTTRELLDWESNLLSTGHATFLYIYINFLKVFHWNSQDLRKKRAFDKITVETSLTRGWYVYLGMLSMIWTHPHATWHCRQWRINTIHVKCQRTEVAMNKPASQFTPTKKKPSEIPFNGAKCYLSKVKPQEYAGQRSWTWVAWVTSASLTGVPHLPAVLLRKTLYAHSTPPPTT